MILPSLSVVFVSSSSPVGITNSVHFSLFVEFSAGGASVFLPVVQLQKLAIFRVIFTQKLKVSLSIDRFFLSISSSCPSSNSVVVSSSRRSKVFVSFDSVSPKTFKKVVANFSFSVSSSGLYIAFLCSTFLGGSISICPKISLSLIAGIGIKEVVLVKSVSCTIRTMTRFPSTMSCGFPFEQASHRDFHMVRTSSSISGVILVIRVGFGSWAMFHIGGTRALLSGVTRALLSSIGNSSPPCPKSIFLGFFQVVPVIGDVDVAARCRFHRSSLSNLLVTSEMNSLGESVGNLAPSKKSCMLMVQVELVLSWLLVLSALMNIGCGMVVPLKRNASAAGAKSAINITMEKIPGM